jgi:hypothetical protein
MKQWFCPDLVGKTSGNIFMGMFTSPHTMVLHDTYKHNVLNPIMIISIGTSCGANAENASVIFYKV